MSGPPGAAAAEPDPAPQPGTGAATQPGAGAATPAGAGSALLHSDHEEGPRAGVPVRLAGALLPLLLGVAAVVYALRLGIGGPRDPGAGLWPLLTGIAIVASALVLLFRERDQSDYEKYTRGALHNMVGIASLALYVVLLPLIGVEIVTLLVTAVWLKYLGGESWRTTVLMSVAITVGVYVLFISVLGAPIPRRLSI